MDSSIYRAGWGFTKGAGVRYNTRKIHVKLV